MSPKVVTSGEKSETDGTFKLLHLLMDIFYMPFDVFAAKLSVANGTDKLAFTVDCFLMQLQGA